MFYKNKVIPVYTPVLDRKKDLQNISRPITIKYNDYTTQI